MEKFVSKLFLMSIILPSLIACSFQVFPEEEVAENQSHLAVTINTSDYPSYNISVMLVDEDDRICKSIIKENKTNYNGFNSISFVFSELDIGSSYKVVANAQVGRSERYVGESDYMVIADPNRPINLKLYKYSEQNFTTDEENLQKERNTPEDEPADEPIIVDEPADEPVHVHLFENETFSMQDSDSILKTKYCSCGMTETESVENVIGLEDFKMGDIEIGNSKLILASDNSIRPFLISEVTVSTKFFSAIVGTTGMIDSDVPQTNITWKQAVDFCNQVTLLYQTANDYAYSKNKVMLEQRLGFRLPTPEELRYAMDNGYITMTEGTKEWCYEIDETDTSFENNAYRRHGVMSADGSTEYVEWTAADATTTFRMARWIQ